MGQFRREGGSDRGFGGGRDRDRGGFGGGKRGFGDDREPKTMHRATCSDCGRSCEVPFRPTGEKPVYCSECFGKQQDSGYGRDSRDSRGGRDFGRDRASSFERPRFEDKKMFSATCDTCGNRCEVPFRPTSGKPVFCDNCFGKGGSMNTSAKSGAGCNCKEGLNAVNAKLDRIIKALNIPATPKVFNDEIEELIDEIAKAEKPVKKAKKVVEEEIEVEAPKKKRVSKK